MDVTYKCHEPGSSAAEDQKRCRGEQPGVVVPEAKSRATRGKIRHDVITINDSGEGSRGINERCRVPEGWNAKRLRNLVAVHGRPQFRLCA
jgi:hypothetical protein